MSVKTVANSTVAELGLVAYSRLRLCANLEVFENRSYSKIEVSDLDAKGYNTLQITKELIDAVTVAIEPARSNFPERYFFDVNGNVYEFNDEVETELHRILREGRYGVQSIPVYAVIEKKTNTAILPFDYRYRCAEEVIDLLDLKVHKTAYTLYFTYMR